MCGVYRLPLAAHAPSSVLQSGIVKAPACACALHVVSLPEVEIYTGEAARSGPVTEKVW